MNKIRRFGFLVTIRNSRRTTVLKAHSNIIGIHNTWHLIHDVLQNLEQTSQWDFVFTTDARITADQEFIRIFEYFTRKKLVEHLSTTGFIFIHYKLKPVLTGYRHNLHDPTKVPINISSKDIEIALSFVSLKLHFLQIYCTRLRCPIVFVTRRLVQRKFNHDFPK